MPAGSDPVIVSTSSGCRLMPIVIVADAMVVLSASVMESSMSAIGIAGPPLVNVAV